MFIFVYICLYLLCFPFSSMQRRVRWPCWRRPALRLANQTLPPLPSCPQSPLAVWETRSRRADLPNPESNTTPWRTSPVSSLTPSPQAIHARMFKLQKGLQIKRLFGCQMETPAVVLRPAQPFLRDPSHQAPVPPPCSPRASPTDKAILPPHRPRPCTWTTNLGAQNRAAVTVAMVALSKKTLRQLKRAWTGLSWPTPATREPAPTRATPALRAAPSRRARLTCRPPHSRG